MPQPKLFKHSVKTNKVVGFLPQPSPPLPAQMNPLVKQQQASAIGTQTPLQNIPGHFLQVTKATPTLEQEDGITHSHIRSHSATKRKQIPQASQTQNTSHHLQDPQHYESHSIVCEVNEINTEQVNCQQQTPKYGFRPYKKRRRHQYRLYNKCSQTGHFIKNCTQFTETEINHEFMIYPSNAFGETL